MKCRLIYCYDAYCGWCYGFSPVIKTIAGEYKDKLFIEVLSGGMIISEKPMPISISASYIQKAYKTVEEYTGIKFGEGFLWHIFNPDKSDWLLSSEKPAIALCVFKEYYPELQVQFASDLQYALNFEGRDLCDDEAYRHLISTYHLPVEEFYPKLHSNEYKEKAYFEFALVKQLKTTGFPALLLQASESKFYMLAKGYTDHETLKARIENVLKEVSTDKQGHSEESR
ncbi:MAG: DsbA family protein [Bacteroidetes bacterium]|nr:DsbA family protein [Bacteroidota bacterium]MBS1975156.1 DsbA family protein [Bacteroidota bacterium]